MIRKDLGSILYNCKIIASSKSQELTVPIHVKILSYNTSVKLTLYMFKQELETHIKKLRDKFGQFEFPPYKTPYDPNNEEAQLSMFLPMVSFLIR